METSRGSIRGGESSVCGAKNRRDVQRFFWRRRVPHTRRLPDGGVRWDGRSRTAPGTSPELRFAARDAGVVPDLLRHLGSFCTAGGQT